MFSAEKKPVNRYASFSRRMWAATIDSLLFAFLLLPFFEMGFAVVYPVPMQSLSEMQFHEQLMMQTNSAHMWAFLSKHFFETGLFTRWLVDASLQMLLLLLLSGVCWRFWSATPGKMLLRIKIVDATTEQPISDQQILMRLWGYLVSTLPLFVGFFWISFDSRRQGWHDKMANTVVILTSKLNS
jgi:uncharacterized RDD family membrane protein YckC